jgi:LuxR family transcriptional regulator
MKQASEAVVRAGMHSAGQNISGIGTARGGFVRLTLTTRGPDVRVNDIVEFMDKTEAAQSARELNAEFEALLSKIGFKYYCIYHAPRPIDQTADLIIAANWDPEWVSRYVEKKYIVIDPTNRFLVRANRSFSWQEALDAYKDTRGYKRMKDMMADGRQNGLAAGYIFPAFSRNGLIGATTVGGPKEIKLSPSEIALLETAYRNCFLKHLEFIGGPLALNVAAGIEFLLTHREHQALNNLAEGHTSQEIGSILKVSTTTADSYINELMKKLGAKNRTHAVAMALRQGLLS